MKIYKISVKAFLEVEAQNEKEAMKRVIHMLNEVELMQCKVEFFIDDHDAYELKDMRLYRD